MRALFLTPGCFDKGGISRYCRYQVEALRTVLGRDNLKVLSLLGPGANAFEMPFEVDWHGSDGGLFDKLQFATQAARFVLSTKPDLVHVGHVNLTPLAISLRRLSGVRTVLNVYGLEIWSGLAKYRRWAMGEIDHVVADCHFTANFVASENLHAVRPDVIWDCIDLERFVPGECNPAVRAKYSLPDKRDHFVVMSLGRLARAARHKGYDRLIEAFALVHAQVRNARLVIAGSGDDRPRLEKLAREHALTETVIFTGTVEEQDLADCYRAASVFSLVSDRGPGRGEGIPLTPLEAMACGTPIIVGNQDGSREAIVDGINGFFIDPFDLAGHVEIILQLSGNADLLERLGTGARKAAELHFGYARFLEQHRDLYARALVGDSSPC
jgi:phosphatidylinositol alpha-1,6-mannosyltransferase